MSVCLLASALPAAGAQKSPIGQILLLLLYLVLIFAGAYFVTRFLGRLMQQGPVWFGAKPGRRGQNFHRIRLVDRLNLGREKSILLLETEKKRYLVGMSDQAFTLLDKEDVEDAPEPPPGQAEEGSEGGEKPFGTLLSRLRREDARKNIPEQRFVPLKALPAPDGRLAASLLQKRRSFVAWLLLFLMVIVLVCTFTGCVSEEELQAALAKQAEAQQNAGAEPLPPLEAQEEEEEKTPGMLDQLVAMLGSRSQSVQIVGLLTVLSLAPSLLIMLTSFVRVVMVLSFTRNAMGLQQMPPNQVLVGLALFLTLFIMAPVVDEIKAEAYIPYITEQITLEEAVERGSVPVRSFMLRQTRASDLAMFCSFAGEEPPATEEQALEVRMSTLIPAFLTSELTRAFEIGFFIYVPFIVIDMIVASTLMAMGMMMLPPIVISLPFKVLLFVVVDGWALTMQTLVSGFR